MKLTMTIICLLAMTAAACSPAPAPNRTRADAPRPSFDGPVTPDNIDRLDPNALFWEMFYRQARQSVLHTRREYFETPERAAERRKVTVNDEIYDFGTRRQVGASIDHRRGEGAMWDKCIDGTYYDYSPSRRKWTPGYSPLCRASNRPFLGDGIIPAGLTDTQAVTMINQLNRESWRFLTAERPRLIEVGGATHIRLPVRARALVDHDGRRWDMQHLIWAFKKTGLDIMAYPYHTADNSAAGADIVYYIDPRTLLPSYMFRQTLRPSETGEPQPAAVTRVEYIRPPNFPADPLADTTPWALSWSPDTR
ncbi:hypothetical protein [Saccharopolyspora phatthalungensis]|uniref:Lipoprotein n=1 Tax=Saccharopolyspora phatthalungensis TaxID=664693 RepID=A0A840Q7G6_9PSEU|nr:hypothetical protein [Saccharopolyspora phatthalungensis]MBB5152743.1 hypothetical protein [Saccharopolyspora phatthalungensis]